MNDSAAKMFDENGVLVKVGDRIGSVLEEDSDGKHEWYDVIYAGNNLLKMESRETTEDR